MSSDDGQSPSDDKDKSEDEGGHGTSLPGTNAFPKLVCEKAVEVKRHLSKLRVNRQIYSENILLVTLLCHQMRRSGGMLHPRDLALRKLMAKMCTRRLH